MNHSFKKKSKNIVMSGSYWYVNCIIFSLDFCELNKPSNSLFWVRSAKRTSVLLTCSLCRASNPPPASSILQLSKLKSRTFLRPDTQPLPEPRYLWVCAIYWKDLAVKPVWSPLLLDRGETREMFLVSRILIGQRGRGRPLIGCVEAREPEDGGVFVEYQESIDLIPHGELKLRNC